MKSKLPFLPLGWTLFFILLAVNLPLAYSSLSILSKLWLAAAGSIAVLVLLFLRRQAPSAPRALQQEFLPALPLGAWLLALGPGLLLRFYKLTSLSTWPNPDEALSASIAFHISRHWDWHFFYTYTQIPFPYLWGWALLIKSLGLSLGTLWLYPALCSALAIPLGYLAARQFLSRSLSFLFTVLLSVSYWGLFAGRVGTSTVLVPLVELAVLYLGGKILKERSPSRLQASLLGLATAAGFYVYPPAWLPLALFIVWTFVWTSLPSRKRAPLLCFLSSLSALLLPFLFFAVQEGFGGYVHTLTVQPVQLSSQFLVSASYLTGSFWGAASNAYYGPCWGGLFDAVSVSLFLLGVIQTLRGKKDPVTRWALAALALSLLPGLLSNNLQFFRIFFIYPFFLLFTALGMRELLRDRPRVWVAALLLAVIASLNFYHLLGPYQARWKDPGPGWGFYKSPENCRARFVLQRAAELQGPGLIFANFQPDMSDPSLRLAVFPFNTAENPALSSIQPRWFAVLANTNYQPFLAKRFPGGEWFLLSEDLDRIDGGLALGVFPSSSAGPGLLEKWKRADAAFQDTAYLFLNRATGTSYEGVIANLATDRPLVEGDPFLSSCFWEKLYYLRLQNGKFGGGGPKDRRAAAEALQLALQTGYPAAHLYNEWGTHLYLMERLPEARKAFEKALQSNPHFSPAARNLEALSQPRRP